MYSSRFSLYPDVVFARSMATDPAWDQARHYADARLRSMAHHAHFFNRADFEFCRTDLKKQLDRLRDTMTTMQERDVQLFIDELDKVSYDEIGRSGEPMRRLRTCLGIPESLPEWKLPTRSRRRRARPSSVSNAA